ncbi:hypothetical protein BDY17DRAFT_100891 [Neohortaea acidophila]|uniref:Uncharacterized protein n=1 Tax=Neohortaea acidophila TaxID=245834 RepID=A0A6A6Q0V9_9PEZI|nr:uncharacterized protein BDY17DRAFT_100891 [Neohortaea acidophila]KAF2485323.1 hypothetical protein BDY17DRAFT_100891 [Neohortaea acidophila]
MSQIRNLNAYGLAWTWLAATHLPSARTTVVSREMLEVHLASVCWVQFAWGRQKWGGGKWGERASPPTEAAGRVELLAAGRN